MKQSLDTGTYLLQNSRATSHTASSGQLTADSAPASSRQQAPQDSPSSVQDLPWMAPQQRQQPPRAAAGGCIMYSPPAGIKEHGAARAPKLSRASPPDLTHRAAHTGRQARQPAIPRHHQSYLQVVSLLSVSCDKMFTRPASAVLFACCNNT